MKVDELISKVKDSVTVGRVYGEPYDKGAVTVIPAALVVGGGGGGTGHDETGGEGEGGGFGMRGRPVGAFVIKGDQVTWSPAVDASRLAAAAALVAVVWLATRPSRLRARAALKAASTT